MNYHRLRGPKKHIAKIFLLVTSYSLLVTILGCDAFVRKFTRKSKKHDMPQEEMVLAPEEYKPTLSKEGLYRQYFLFWKSWQDELIKALLENTSHKKQVDCAQQAVKNLLALKDILEGQQKKKIEGYISASAELKEAIAQDVYGNNAVLNRQQASRLKRNILRDFSYPKIKASVI